jgi:hypothetical protein
MTMTAPVGTIHPYAGPQVGADDHFFREVDHELSDRGFLVTSADSLITWARTGSLMWMTFGLAWTNQRHNPLETSLACSASNGRAYRANFAVRLRHISN